ncbi:hypothetical protein EIP86_000037 [Pleurotus ostreatoroseus]|nr:hypothetical protein EIP86_000037 [Pleurotus ostreatoroseus]
MLHTVWQDDVPSAAGPKGIQCPEDGLLQALDGVQDAEMHNPQHLDVHGLATGTTVGRVNGLESFTRVYKEYGISQKSLEVAVLPYDTVHGTFSQAGDSGAVVLDRAGRIVGVVTGGSGPADTGETETTDLT